MPNSINIRQFPTNSGGKLYFGSWPNVQTLRKLKDLKVDVIWNLAEELKLLIPYEKHFVPQVIHGNIEDFYVPENMGKFAGQLNKIVGLLESGKNVFIHCWQGVGRTGMILASIDMLLNNHKPNQALANAKSAAGGPETLDQIKFVHNLHSYLNGKPINEKEKSVKQPQIKSQKKQPN